MAMSHYGVQKPATRLEGSTRVSLRLSRSRSDCVSGCETPFMSDVPYVGPR